MAEFLSPFYNAQRNRLQLFCGFSFIKRTVAGNKRHNLLVEYREPVLILKLRCVTDALAYCVTLYIGFEIAPCKIFMCVQHMFCIHLV